MVPEPHDSPLSTSNLPGGTTSGPQSFVKYLEGIRAARLRGGATPQSISLLVFALCVLPGNAGDFYVLTWDLNQGNWPDFPKSPQAAIHFSREGAVVERLLDVSWGQARPGNVFVDDSRRECSWS